MSYSVFNTDTDNVIVRHYSDNGEEFFSISEKINEENGLIELSFGGNLRYDIALDVQDELIGIASQGKKILIDLKNLKYISNAGQKSLLHVQRRMDDTRKGSFTLTNLPEAIFEEFDRIGLTQLLMIE